MGCVPSHLLPTFQVQFHFPKRDPSSSNSKKQKQRIRKSAISQPTLISSPTSGFSFDDVEERPLPSPGSSTRSTARSEERGGRAASGLGSGNGMGTCSSSTKSTTSSTQRSQSRSRSSTADSKSTAPTSASTSPASTKSGTRSQIVAKSNAGPITRGRGVSIGTRAIHPHLHPRIGLETNTEQPRGLEPGQEDGQGQEPKTYLTPREVDDISAQIRRFVRTLTGYGELIERTHTVLYEDVHAILRVLSPTNSSQHRPQPPPQQELVPNETRTPLLQITNIPSQSSKPKREPVPFVFSLLTPPPETQSTSTTPCLSNPYSTPHLLPFSSPYSIPYSTIHPSPCIPVSPPSTSATSPSLHLQTTTHLSHLLTLLTLTHKTHTTIFKSTYFPLLTLLPQNLITFSRLSIEAQKIDVWRHLVRQKGDRRRVWVGEETGVEGLLLRMIRGLGGLVGAGAVGEEDVRMGLEDVERAVEGCFDVVLAGLKEEEERRSQSHTTRLVGQDNCPEGFHGLESGGDGKGKSKEKEVDKEWCGAAMKWRVFGLVCKERIKALREGREEVLRGRLELSGVLVGVFEGVKELGGGELAG